MNVTPILNTLFHANQLKQTARTGWVQRGIPQAENVAAHSYGVVLTTLLLAQLVEEPIDIGKALSMAALHDLAEGLTTDIPRPAWRFLPAGSKQAAERQAIEQILGDASFTVPMLELWEELHLNTSAEAHLVHDADRIDLYLQAVVYEQQTSNRRLEEFWRVSAEFHFPQAQAIYEALQEKRQRNTGNSGEL
jgi:putative hydrolase of HD superfamily